MMKAVGKSSALNTPTVARAPPLDLNTVAPPFSPPHPNTAPRPDRHFGLRPAPVFHPSAEEFKDPLRYIESIRVEGELSGICKIVPPKGWNPDFAMDTQTFWFRPRIMRLNSMEGSSRAILNYLDQLQKFHNQQGTQFTRIPMLDKKPMNLFELKKEVAKRGGYLAVTNSKQWAAVGRAIGLGGKTCTSLSHSVKSAYVKWVLPYEDFMAKHGSPAPTRSGSPLEEPTTETGEEGPSTRRKKSTRSKKKLPVAALLSLEGSESPSPKKAILPTDYLPKPGLELCEICGGGENDEQMLLCDGCNRGYHLYCFDPPMSAIPNTDWYCPDCLRGSGHDYGFEEGELRSLYHFQQVANTFKEQHFRQRLGLDSKERVVVTEHDVEKEFWRLVESPYDDVEVEYGADLHSSQHGSGFPVPEKQPTNPYSTCGWNLNNMPVLPESLFCNIRNDISGMMIPWLYVGMVFSTFCWHTEDHYTYSINYLHWGETKTWYGIPASNADKFEATMKQKIPELFEGNPDLLFHLTTMLSPGVLVNNGVDVVGTDQRPGEFVITFPRAYHAGFNQGFNFAEAVNFALPNWLPYGLDCVDRYQFHRKQPVFSHDELVIATSKRDIDVRAAVWLKPALEHLRDRELTARLQVRKQHPGIREVVENMEINHEEEDQCALCHSYCYVSGLRCDSCQNGRIVCFDHEDELCECEHPQLTMTVRFEDAQLQEFVEHVTKIASRPSEWKVKYDNLLAQYRRPPLKELQRLLSASEKIPYVIEEAVLLGEYVEKASEWVDRASRILQKKKRSTGRRSVGGSVEEVEEMYGERTLDNIESLLSEAESLAFEAPEMKLVEALAGSVYEFRAEARAVLDSPTVTSKQVQDTLDWAKTLDVQVPELELLTQKLHELDWIVQAETALASISSVTHEEVLELIDVGRGFGVKADHPLMQRLKQSRHEGDEWRILAAGLLKQRSMDFSDLKEVAAEGQGVPVVKELWEKVGGLLEKCDDWLKRVKLVLESSEGEGKKYPTHMLFALVSDMESVPVRLDEVQTLRTDAQKVMDWTTRCRRVLRSGSAKTCADIISEMETNVEGCTKPIAEQGEVFCICRTRVDEGLMIECETCHEWYHSTCIKLSKKAAKTQSHYTCPVCDVWSARAPAKRPTVEQLSHLIEEADALPRWQIDEVDGLRRMTAMVTEWKDKARATLHDDKGNDVVVVKGLLRCGEGMWICVEDEIGQLRDRVQALCPKPAPLSPSPSPQLAPTPMQADAPTNGSTKHQSGVELFCLCRQPHREEDGEMIGCDKCSEWYHFKCIGVTAAQAEGMDTYVCPVCVESKAAKRERQGSDPSAAGDANGEGATDGRLKIKLKIGVNVSGSNGSVTINDNNGVPKAKRKSQSDSANSTGASGTGEEKKKSHKKRKDSVVTPTSASSVSAPAFVPQGPQLGTATAPPTTDLAGQKPSDQAPPAGKERKRKKDGDGEGGEQVRKRKVSNVAKVGSAASALELLHGTAAPKRKKAPKREKVSNAGSSSHPIQHPHHAAPPTPMDYAALYGTPQYAHYASAANTPRTLFEGQSSYLGGNNSNNPTAPHFDGSASKPQQQVPTYSSLPPPFQVPTTHPLAATSPYAFPPPQNLHEVVPSVHHLLQLQQQHQHQQQQQQQQGFHMQTGEQEGDALPPAPPGDATASSSAASSPSASQPAYHHHQPQNLHPIHQHAPADRTLPPVPYWWPQQQQQHQNHQQQQQQQQHFTHHQQHQHQQLVQQQQQQFLQQLQLQQQQQQQQQQQMMPLPPPPPSTTSQDEQPGYDGLGFGFGA
ncbi:PLU-1-like protein-domain-containing protein [Powellomyces hirtus]|nr:PLU-1-like protein-domain-containing protein [Powellomyces hirtus]